MTESPPGFREREAGLKEAEWLQPVPGTAFSHARAHMGGFWLGHPCSSRAQLGTPSPWLRSAAWRPFPPSCSSEPPAHTCLGSHRGWWASWDPPHPAQGTTCSCCTGDNCGHFCPGPAMKWQHSNHQKHNEHQRKKPPVRREMYGFSHSATPLPHPLGQQHDINAIRDKLMLKVAEIIATAATLFYFFFFLNRSSKIDF